MCKVPKFYTLDDVDVQGKRVVVRADLNVPIHNGRVIDASRITRFQPTVIELRKRGANVIILSHLGRPNGPDPDLSLHILVDLLSKIVGEEVKFNDPSAQLCLMENVRFDPREETNDPSYAKELSELGDIYVNDAFSVSHRAHASVAAITQFMPSYAGRLMQSEIEALTMGLEHPKHPVMAIIGGSKVSTKLQVIKHILDKVDVFIPAGGIANTFLLARGLNIGNSLVEPELLDTVLDIEIYAQKIGCKILGPIDVVVTKDLQSPNYSRICNVNTIASNEMIVDIGPRSVEYFYRQIDEVKTVLWNGPFGVFEIPPFDRGTVDIARYVAKADVYSLAGGGETVSAINHAGCETGFSYISLAGGAFLEWLEGRTLPGVDALCKK